jgi:hypothetical protein
MGGVFSGAGRPGRLRLPQGLEAQKNYDGKADWTMKGLRG